MGSSTAVILAAGQGTRMRSKLPKVLHPLCGRPLVEWPIYAALAARVDQVVVVDSPKRPLHGRLPTGVASVVQDDMEGTAGAVLAAQEKFAGQQTVVVLAGDVPLVSSELIAALIAQHEQSGAAATIVTMELSDPSGYGRIVRDRDGKVEAVVETKTPGDATPAQLAIREVNTGIFAFTAELLPAALRQTQSHNAQGEHYLPDVLPILRQGGHEIATLAVDNPHLTLGVNDRLDLARITAITQRAIHERLMLSGITIVDPFTTLIDVDVVIGEDTVIEPGCSLRGVTKIGERCTIGPSATLIDAQLSDEVRVVHSYLDSCTVNSNSCIGPFSYLRPQTVIDQSAKVGAFVEVKNSNLGKGVKVPHLSYIGDTDIGEGTNLGAGTITANYDGTHKHRTTIGKNVRGGVDTSFVAPVTIGDGAYTGAGSVITEDVPENALAVARARQRNIDNYAQRKSKVKS